MLLYATALAWGLEHVPALSFRVPLGVSYVAAAWMVMVPLVILVGVASFVGARYIPNDRVGIVEKLWSLRGSVPGGRIIAFAGEAGYQARVLRGGLHFRLWKWQYTIHKAPLVTIPQGKIGYVYSRDGDPLPAGQTLARVADCNHFQDAEAFMGVGGNANSEGGGSLASSQHPAAAAPPAARPGQRGRQRAILREGVYAINVALFTVITEDRVYTLDVDGKDELRKLQSWQTELKAERGFDPVVIGEELSAVDPLRPEQTIAVDSIGIVTVHDGQSLAPGEIIAPSVGNDAREPHYHNNFQDPEAFLAAGGRRGRQYVPLVDGTYFVNRWFATVELLPKTIVPIGYVGVVVSYYGPLGADVSGDAFRHGERVARGERGVWAKPLGPGKYPFNTYAGQIILVPTTNFVLHWITGKAEAHRYDDSLKSIDLVTRDAYEPMLPLSVVVHIDYLKAPSVIQRFGDVKKLITQTLDPMLSAYFRDVAHKKTMLELLQHRDVIQVESRAELQRRFAEFDMECVDVLIGKPDTAEGSTNGSGKIETLLEQLRQRQLSREQIETFQHQRAAADELKKLNEAQALAQRQLELTASAVQVEIAHNHGDADLARARKAAEQTVVTAEAEGRRQVLAGQGEGARLTAVGDAEAAVLVQKARSFGDPRLYALTLLAEHLAGSTQPLVPQHVFVAGGGGMGAGGGDGGRQNVGMGLLGTLVDLLVAEKSGFAIVPPFATAPAGIAHVGTDLPATAATNGRTAAAPVTSGTTR